MPTMWAISMHCGSVVGPVGDTAHCASGDPAAKSLNSERSILWKKPRKRISGITRDGSALSRLVAATSKLRMGDPRDPEVFIGPMISAGEAARLDGWIQQAVDGGATLLCGGKREGAMLEATLLEGVEEGQAVVCQEAFGPVAVLSRYRDFGEALESVNRSVFGLQA